MMDRARGFVVVAISITILAWWISRMVRLYWDAGHRKGMPDKRNTQPKFDEYGLPKIDPHDYPPPPNCKPPKSEPDEITDCKKCGSSMSLWCDAEVKVLKGVNAGREEALIKILDIAVGGTKKTEFTDNESKIIAIAKKVLGYDD